jgi:hypothetical protein
LATPLAKTGEPPSPNLASKHLNKTNLINKEKETGFCFFGYLIFKTTDPVLICPATARGSPWPGAERKNGK